MADLDKSLFWILMQGLPAGVAERLAQGGVFDALPAQEGGSEFARRLELWLRREGVRLRQPLALPPRGEVLRLAGRLREARVSLAWRGEPEYPERLARRMGNEAPAWVWLGPGVGRLHAPACAIVGSRRAEPLFLAAARRLGRALAEAGVVVVSGLAEGADTAAHQGAVQGAAGTVAVPARGVLRVNLCDFLNPGGRLTLLGLGHPDASFSAGLAIRRNIVLAALGEGLVLVASELRGGSSYAVRWATERRWPLWCFEAGRATPPANRHLLRAGLALPLPLGAEPREWVAEMIPTLTRRRAVQGAAQPAHREPHQPSFFGF